MSKYVDVKQIEFDLTYRCNSHCKHCHVDAERRRSDPAVIDSEDARHLIRAVAQEYAPESVGMLGGEPLLFPDTACAIIQTAADCGIGSRWLITSAGSPRQVEKFKIVARKLADSGVSGIRVSVDAFHQEYIPIEVVERNVRALLEAGIHILAWNVSWLVSKEHDNRWNDRTRSILASLEHLQVTQVSDGLVQPRGNALVQLREFMPPETRRLTLDWACGDVPYTKRPDQIRSLPVEPDGRTIACWGLPIGEAGQPDVLKALQSYDPYRVPEIRAVLEGGMEALVNLARKKGVESDPEGYSSVCKMCESLRRAIARSDV